LEKLAAANGLKHEHAHDALSDVFATIAVAQLIRERQGKLFEYLLRYRNKAAILALLASGEALVWTDNRVRHPSKTTVIVPRATDKTGRVEAIDARTGEVVWLRANRCPTLAPLSVLTDENWRSLEIEPEAVYKAAAVDDLTLILEAPPAFREGPRSSGASEYTLETVDGALYDGFLSDQDKRLCALVRRTEADDLADLQPEFTDERLGPLLLLYKARNFPASLAADEAAAYESFAAAKRARLAVCT
jgi:exodeoxyribonuclease-1